MADSDNPGQFGNREDTEEQARQGGLASSGSFGEENGADPSEAGRMGGQDSSTGGADSYSDEDSDSDSNAGQFGEREDTEEQARRGGEASSGSFGEENGADPSEAGRMGGSH